MARDSWKRIRDAVTDRIARGDWGPGTRLPTEAELGRLFEAGRHSVRRALQALAVEGKLRVVQGSGTYVQAAPLIDYHISRRTRFRQNLLDQGLTPAGEHIAAETLPAPADIAQAMGVAPGAPLHMLLRRGLADGLPISLGRSWHPADLFPDLVARRAAGISVTDIYRDAGIADYFRKRTTILTRRAEADEAALLMQHPDQPVLVVTKTDVTAEGRVIGYAQAVWAGDRVQFSIDTLDDEGPQRPA